MGPAAEPSPVLRRRSLSSRSEAIDIEFGDLHRAAKAAGGSINDAYLAGLCGALRRYHEAMGVPIEHAADGGAGQPAVRRRIRRAATDSPASISRRRSASSIPEARIKNIRSQMTRKRDERAIDMVGAIAPVLSLLPDTRARVDGRLGRQLRRAGQQRAGLRGRHLHRGRKDPAAVRPWAAAGGGDDGRADVAGRLLHRSPPATTAPSITDGDAVRPVPAAGIRRSPRARRRRPLRPRVVHTGSPTRAQSTITERKCSAQ